MKKASISDVRHPSITTNDYVDFMHVVVDFLICNRLEISMFFAAVLSYLILWRARLPNHRDPRKQKQATSENTADVVQEEGETVQVEATLPILQQHRVVLDQFSSMRVALRMSNFEEALECLKEVKAAWHDRGSAERLVPLSIMSMLIELAWEKDKFNELVCEMHGLQQVDKSIDAMLAKCIGSDKPDTVRHLERLARKQREILPDSTYALLIQALHPRDAHIPEIVDEIMARDSSSFSPDLASALLKHSSLSSDVGIVDRLLKKMKPKQIPVLGDFMWFYIGMEQFEKACDVYEIHMKPVLQHTNGVSAMTATMQESIIDVAVLCGRTELAQQVMNNSTSQRDPFKHCVEAVMAEFARFNAIITQWVVLVF